MTEDSTETLKALRNGLGWLDQCSEGGAYVPPVVLREMREAIEHLSTRDTEAMRLLQEARVKLINVQTTWHGRYAENLIARIDTLIAGKGED